MAIKLAKDLKKGDKIKSIITDGIKHYPGFCTITDISGEISVYNPNGLRPKLPNGRAYLRYIQMIADSGPLKGIKSQSYVEDEDAFIVPDRPGKFWRVIDAIFSK